MTRAEDQFHRLIDSIADYAIFVLDPAGHVSTWNPGAKKTKGYDEAEIVGRHFSIFYTPEDREAGLPETLLETVRREGRVESEGWRVRKDGSRFWANVTIALLVDDAGEQIGFAKVTRDLTERRAQQEQLLRSEERFRLVVESVVDYAIYMLSPDGLVTTWNRGAERMKGYLATEIIGTHFSVFFPESDVQSEKPARELATAAAEGRFEDEGWRVRRGGERFWASVVLTALRNDRGELIGFAKITRDLTARRLSEETEKRLFREQAARALAEEFAKRAAEANRIKDEFLATVSHELRTPLNAIVGWASLLRQQALEPSFAKAIEVIDRNARAQAKIVDDILDVSRIIAGKLRLDPRPTDLAVIVKEAIEVVRHSADSKGIAIQLELPASPCLLVGDADRLQQVVWNLLSNAVKFTGTDGTISVRISHAASALVVSVTDTGKGIDLDFLPFVFDRFKQADPSTTRRFGGLGLGLALARHIAELHGGSIEAASDGPGTGATFKVTLPINPRMSVRAPPAEGRPTELNSLMPDVLRDLRILVVDDDADGRELVSLLLTHAGATVKTTASAAEAFEAIREFRPSVLVSDIAMADEDGYSLVRRVRELDVSQGGGIPSIALTAYTRREDRNKAIAAGFTTHIGKPVSASDLIAVVASVADFAPVPSNAHSPSG